MLNSGGEKREQKLKRQHAALRTQLRQNTNFICTTWDLNNSSTKD